MLITPREVLALHKIRLEFDWLTEWSPPYHRTPADPGPLDSSGKPTNPRYQPLANRSQEFTYAAADAVAANVSSTPRRWPQPSASPASAL